MGFVGATVACSRRSDSRTREKNSRRKKHNGRLAGGKGKGAPVHELFPPLIDRRLRNCNMNYSLTEFPLAPPRLVPSPVFPGYNLTRSPAI